MCTNLSIPDSANPPALVTARTMDETPDMPSVVQLVPAGTSLLSGVTKIPFVGIGITLDVSLPNLKPIMYADGMNTAGLSAGALWLPDTQYQKPGPNTIYDTEVCGWALGNCQTVNDVAAGLQSRTVVESTTDRGPIASLLHWVFTDASGAVLIAEYLGGVLTLARPASAVLTNSPPYSWQTANVANCYGNLTVSNVATRVENQQVNGSGMLGVPGDATPPSRFVRMALFTQSGYAAPDAQHSVGLALQILQTAIVPYGTVMTAAGGLGDHTQWGVVRDHASRTFYFFSPFNNTLYAVDLKTASFGSSIRGIPLDQPNWFTPAPFS